MTQIIAPAPAPLGLGGTHGVHAQVPQGLATVSHVCEGGGSQSGHGHHWFATPCQAHGLGHGLGHGQQGGAWVGGTLRLPWPHEKLRLSHCSHRQRTRSATKGILWCPHAPAPLLGDCRPPMLAPGVRSSWAPRQPPPRVMVAHFLTMQRMDLPQRGNNGSLLLSAY